MDCSIHPAAAEQGFVGGIDNGIDGQLGDVGGNDLESGIVKGHGSDVSGAIMYLPARSGSRSGGVSFS